jgi:hypothetical protein
MLDSSSGRNTVANISSECYVFSEYEAPETAVAQDEQTLHIRGTLPIKHIDKDRRAATQEAEKGQVGA